MCLQLFFVFAQWYKFKNTKKVAEISFSKKFMLTFNWERRAHIGPGNRFYLSFHKIVSLLFLLGVTQDERPCNSLFSCGNIIS